MSKSITLLKGNLLCRSDWSLRVFGHVASNDLSSRNWVEHGDLLLQVHILCTKHRIDHPLEFSKELNYGYYLLISRVDGLCKLEDVNALLSGEGGIFDVLRVVSLRWNIPDKCLNVRTYSFVAFFFNLRRDPHVPHRWISLSIKQANNNIRSWLKIMNSWLGFVDH